jgi:prepilin-type N-terminal cleavage/methylation domain-containing protein
MRRGVTLVELVITVAVIGFLVALVAPRASEWLDRLYTQRAALELVTFYHRGRMTAITRSTRVRLEFGGDALVGVLEGVFDSTFVRLPGPNRHGVQLRASRPVIRIHPNGIGWGAANTKLVLWRGEAAESLTTSRLGRIRRWR